MQRLNVISYGFKGKKAVLIDHENAKIINVAADATDQNNHRYAIMPGLFDTHIHGNCGHDFADQNLDEKALLKIASSLAASGVAYCLPTFVSMKLSDLKNNLITLDNFIKKQDEFIGITKFLGVHLEGPFIAKNCKGAHDINVLQDTVSIDKLIELIRAAPTIQSWKITLAPELPGAIQFIKDCQNLIVDGHPISVKIFIGHTNADATFLEAAFKAGAIGFTHLGNANCEAIHRATDKKIQHADLKSNVVKFALNENNTHNSYYELITDGHHLSSEFINFVAQHHENKIILITDALGPTGLADGLYQLGSLKIEKKDQVFTLAGKETLAGSASTYPTIVKKFGQVIAKKGQALWDVLYSAAILNPHLSALDNEKNLADEKNFVVLDQDGTLVLSVTNGKTYFHSNDFICHASESWHPEKSNCSQVTGSVTPRCP